MSTAPQTNSSPGILSSIEERRGGRALISDSILTGIVFALVLTVIQRAIGFGRGVLFCRFMTDQQLGQWSMVWSYLMLLAPVAVLGLPGCFGKFTEHYRQRGQLKTFIIRIGLISTALTLCLSATIWSFPESVASLLFRDPSQVYLVRAMAIALVVVTASNFMCSLMESLCQVRTVTWMRFLTGTAFAILGTLFLIGWNGSASAATCGFAIACLLGTLPAVWILTRRGDSSAEVTKRLTHQAMWKRIGPYAIWLWASDLLNNLFEVSDRFMLLQWSRTTAEIAQSTVGQYHCGRVIPLVLVSISGVLAGILLPYMSKSWESNAPSFAAKQSNAAIKIVSLSFTIAGVVALLFSPLLFESVLQGRYDSGLNVLPLTLVYCIWLSLMTVGQNYLWVAEKGKWAVMAIGIGLALNLILNMLLIPVMGLPGAVLATAGGNLTILILIFGINHFVGCKTDLGIWICAAIPLVVLLPKPIGVVAIAAIVALCCCTPIVFSSEEKKHVLKFVQRKLGNRLPGNR